MPVTCACTTRVLTVAEANAAIRRYVAGRRTWTRAELAELDRLRAEWQQAVRESIVAAA